MTQHVLPYLITWPIKVSHCLGKNTKKINQDLTWKNTVDLAWTLSSLETSTLVWNPSLAPGRPAGPKKSFKIINSSSSSDKVEMKGAKDLELNSFPSKSASFLNKEAVSVFALIQRIFFAVSSSLWWLMPFSRTIQMKNAPGSCDHSNQSTWKWWKDFCLDSPVYFLVFAQSTEVRLCKIYPQKQLVCPERINVHIMFFPIIFLLFQFLFSTCSQQRVLFFLFPILSHIPINFALLFMTLNANSAGRSTEPTMFSSNRLSTWRVR